MPSNTNHDSGVEFLGFPRDAGIEDASSGTAPLEPLRFLDIRSTGPLPALSAKVVAARAEAPGHSGASGRTSTGSRTPGGIWLDGDVLMCGCPDCGAPMSIRLWLMIADCWQCGISIELTEQQEREARQLLEQRERPQPAPASPTPRPPKPAGQPQPEAESRRPAPAPVLETPRGTPSLVAVPVAAPGPMTAKGPTVEKAPADARKVDSRPVPTAPQRRQVTVPSGGYAARATTSRPRARAIPTTTAWLSDFFRDVPAWLISLIFHLVLLTLLGLLTMAGEEDRSIQLSVSVSRDLNDGGMIDPPSDEAQFDLPITPDIDLTDRQQREAVLQADQEAREIRIQPDAVEPQLPQLQQIKRQVAAAAGPRVALAARDPRLRIEMVRKEGGTTLTEAAVARALRWLARRQRKDGRWELDGAIHSDVAGTGLALLPFLGAGQTHLVGRYKDTVSRGLGWLVNHQKKNGDLRGDSAANSGMYAQGQCAIVLCEAFLLSGDERLRDPAQKAVDFIVQAQYPDGGWRYEPNREASEKRGDTSVLGWQLMALQSARAAGLAVPEETLELAGQYLDRASSDNGARYSYMRGEPPTATMTAEALLCRMYLGWTLEEPGLRAGIQALAEEAPPAIDSPNFYYWYYGTQAFHHVGGRRWEEWNLKLRDLLVNSQDAQGPEAGSWPPQQQFDHAGGRIYTTSLAACTLEVYYRHLPIFRQIKLD